MCDMMTAHPSVFHQAQARRHLLNEYAAIRQQMPAFLAEVVSTITQLVWMPSCLKICSARRLEPARWRSIATGGYTSWSTMPPTHARPGHIALHVCTY